MSTFAFIKSFKGTYAELDVGGEEVDALVGEQVALDKGGGNDALLSVQTPQQSVGELGTGVGHAERSAAGSVLSLDDLVTTELDPVDKLVEGLASDALASSVLGQQGDDGRAGVAADDGDVALLGGDIANGGQEAGSTDDVEGGDTEETLGVEDTGLLERSGDDGDGGVDGVGDDKDVGVWGAGSDGAGEVTDDGSVGLQEILLGNSSATA